MTEVWPRCPMGVFVNFFVAQNQNRGANESHRCSHTWRIDRFPLFLPCVQVYGHTVCVA